MEPLTQNISRPEAAIARLASPRIGRALERIVDKQATVALHLEGDERPIRIPVSTLRILDYILANMVKAHTLRIVPVGGEDPHHLTEEVKPEPTREERRAMIDEIIQLTHEMEQELTNEG